MMFSAVGPGLLDEAEEKALRRSLNSWRSSFHEEAVVAFDENVLADGEDVQDVEVKLPDETFGNLVVEFRALGLITWSERKRSVSDRGSYWALTPCGDDHLTTLRASTPEAASAARERSADSELQESQHDDLAEAEAAKM